MLLDIKDADVEYLKQFDMVFHRYDAFLVDVWGVLHDGNRAYPGVVECLEKLKKAGKIVILISNSARQGKDVAATLEQFAITSRFYDHIVTSGDTARAAFLKRGKILKELGSVFYLLGSESYNFSEGLPVKAGSSLEKADFILHISITGNPSSTIEYQAVLQKAAALQMTMVCVNPDLKVVRGGIPGIAPGAVASYYKELGGRVIYFGKPYPAIYKNCFDLLDNFDKKRIAAVGDAVPTDIAGACGVDLDSCLIATGIHKEKLENLPGDVEEFVSLCRGENNFPTAIFPGFRA